MVEEAQLEVAAIQNGSLMLSGSAANSSNEEIPYDQLMGSKHEDSDGQPQQMIQQMQIELNQLQPEPEELMQLAATNILNLGLAQPTKAIS